MAEAVKSITLKLQFSRLQFLLFLLVLVLVIAGIIFYKDGLFGQGYEKLMRADGVITVTDAKTKSGLPAIVSLVNTKNNHYSFTSVASKAGQLDFDKLVAGNYQIIVRRQGYESYSANIKLKRGKNNKNTVEMSPIPPKQITVSGTVIDYINELPVPDASITLDSQTVRSDQEGKFTFDKITASEYEISAQKSGYVDFSAKITADKPLDKVVLVPTGKIVFVSNRDKGKKSVFVANYDGSDATPLIARVGDSEDFNPIVSSDGRRVAFMSTREGKKDKGQPLNGLYVVDIDGKNLTKINDRADYGYYWTNDSKNLIWQSTTFEDNNQITKNASVYNVTEKNSSPIYSTKDSASNVIANDSGTKFAYSLNIGSTGTSELYIYDVSSKASNKLLGGTNSLYVSKFNKNDELIYSSWTNNQTKYYSYNLSGGNAQEVQFEYPKRYTVKSPSDKFFAYIEERDGKNNCFIATNDNGAGEKQISRIDTAIGLPYWSADSKYVFFNSLKSGENALFVAGVNGGTAKKVVDIARDGYGFGQ